MPEPITFALTSLLCAAAGSIAGGASAISLAFWRAVAKSHKPNDTGATGESNERNRPECGKDAVIGSNRGDRSNAAERSSDAVWAGWDSSVGIFWGDHCPLAVGVSAGGRLGEKPNRSN
ncbi:MAG: hypothetical protein EHM42_15955 [Planctomycetaceae bacterium]|nr:MAG: hypothetical protein EHM42_15955 [Planctomycetaceae bacterium]